MRRFVKLTEVNQWEGETWHWWLQLDGNTQELDKLAVFIERTSSEDDDDDQYYLNMDKTRFEDEVDLLVEESDYGYSRTHNKVVGILNLGNLDLIDDAGQILRKGNIEEFFS